MKEFFKDWDRATKNEMIAELTIVLIVVPLIFFLFFKGNSEAIFIAISSILILFVIIFFINLLCFSYRISAENNNLTIHKLCGNVVIRISDISYFTLIGSDDFELCLQGNMRRGPKLLGYWGTYNHHIIGSFNMYSTRKDNIIFIVVNKDGKRKGYMLSFVPNTEAKKEFATKLMTDPNIRRCPLTEYFDDDYD